MLMAGVRDSSADFLYPQQQAREEPLLLPVGAVGSSVQAAGLADEPRARNQNQLPVLLQSPEDWEIFLHHLSCLPPRGQFELSMDMVLPIPAPLGQMPPAVLAEIPTVP